MGLILRLVKGSALTYSELDSNFTFLNQTISSSVSGTIGTLPVFTEKNAIGNSIVTQVGSNIQVNNVPVVLSTQTGSFATTGSNTFYGDQIINGKITAQTLVVQTVSSSIVYSSGSNIFGNSLSNTQTLSGSTYLVGAGYLNGVPITTGGQPQLNGTGFVKASGTTISYDNSTYYSASNPAGYTTNTGTVTSVSGTGTVSGLTLTGTVTTTGNLTLGGTLSLTSGQITTGLGYTPYNSTNPNGYTSNTGTVTSVSGTGTVSGLTLTGTVTSTGNLTLGGSLSLTSGQITTGLGYTPYNSTNPDGYITNKNDTYTSTAKITDIITLTAAEYAGIGSPSSNVLYVII